MSFIKSLIYSFFVSAIIVLTLEAVEMYPVTGLFFVGIISLVPLAILIHIIRILNAILDELKKSNRKNK